MEDLRNKTKMPLSVILPSYPHPRRQLLNPISLTFLCMCALVEPVDVTLLGALVAVEGEDVRLTCLAASSNPPVQIRWWLGHKELDASAVTMEEVQCCKQRGDAVETRTQKLLFQEQVSNSVNWSV